MRRSHINTILADGEDFMKIRNVTLPPFANWDPETFTEKVTAHGYAEIVQRGLGWTVTDFGLDDFAKEGLVVFTARMGDHNLLSRGRGKLYGEKYLIQRDGQRTPFHTHRVKTEDVINKGQGSMMLRLFHAMETGDLDEDRLLRVQVDGQTREMAPGEVVVLRAGESLTIEPNVYHEFSASGGDVLASEISLANDDANDNFFYDPVGVALEIEEDEPPRRLLVQDYPSLFPSLL